MSGISVVAVAYNSTINSIPAVKTGLSSDYVKEVIVCDNSTVDLGNERRARETGVIYVPMYGNKGLPKAYEAGIEHCTGDVVCLFDDDTEVEEGYFYAVASLLSSGRKWDIALPLVMSGDTVLSPCEFNGYKARMFSDRRGVREVPSISGINSGMAIKKALLNRVKHDSSLFLDLVDHKFIADAKRVGASVVYLNGPVLRQSYSLETDSVESALVRLSIFEHDARCFYSSSLIKRIYCEFMLIFRKVKLIGRYRTTRFVNRTSITQGGK